MIRRMMRLGMIALAVVLSAAPLRAATLFADYRFDDSLASSVGGAPDLVYGGGAPAFSNYNINSLTDRALDFASGAGLSLTTPLGSITPASYTIALLSKFNSGLGLWRRVFDPFNPASDAGLYVDSNSKLTVYNFVTHEGPTFINTGEFHTLVFSYDGTTGRAYLDGAPEVSVNFNFQISGVASNLVMRFFKDDVAENAPGSVARLQFYNGVLSDSAIAGLNLSSLTSIPEPSTLALLPLAAAALFRRRR